MVKIGLQIKANLEYVSKLYTNHPEYQYCLKLKCLSCGEESDKWHDISEEDGAPSSGQSKHVNNFTAKCKLCSRENSLDIIRDSHGKLTSEDQGKFKNIVTFDCRGLEPTDFAPSTGWIAKVEGSNKTYTDIDLSEKEWVEYDENIKESIGVYELEHQFVKLK